MLLAFSVFYLAGLAVLLSVAYSRRWFSRYALAKVLLSLEFVLLAFAAAAARGHLGQPFFLGLLPCLGLCLAGDWALGLANVRRQFFSRWFRLGAAAFTLAHGGFCLLFTLAPPGAAWRLWDAALPACLLAATLLCVRHERFKLRRMHLEVPAAVYSVCVGLMCARAFSFALARGFDRQGALAALGALLFLFSDAVLLFLYFYVRPRRMARAVNLTAYYLAMLCLTLAV